MYENQKQIKNRSKTDQKQIKNRSKTDQKQIKSFPAKASPTVQLPLIFSHASSNTAKRDLGAGRAQVLRSGPSRMDAARAPSGHGCPFGAGPRSKTGAREPDAGGPNQEQALLVTFSAF
ncbi:hypothetical protein IFT47_22290 [Pseudomonas sp. CFBP 13711]|uniref:hypothetical protein n=1 Tax=Pseudomonas sp. CFBP 13711 TaxID=2775310 RepID=UPI00177BC1BC|nr:hypothetical protein [Pseudomonas sp. CFBP 13711]MBD8709366.1 hypothetical protein [Pseudomonas sp. CFBP 13711]